jgi:proline-rich protein PRCC
MLNLDYGSDHSDSDTEESTQTNSTSKPLVATAGPSKAAPKPTIATTSKLGLPPPSSKLSSSLSLPAPKTKRVKKITIELPEPSKEDEEDEDSQPAAKKPRLGAGASSLLSMLPAPKQKEPVPSESQRVLGGGKGPGLVFSTSRASSSVASAPDPEDSGEDNAPPKSLATSLPPPQATSKLAFLPASLGKGRKNVNIEDVGLAKKPTATIAPAAPTPAIDFFSLGNSIVFL